MSTIPHLHIRGFLFKYHACEIAGILFFWVFSCIAYRFLVEVSAGGVVAGVPFWVVAILLINFLLRWFSVDISGALPTHRFEEQILEEVCKRMGVPTAELYILSDRTDAFVFPGPFCRRVCLGEYLRDVLTKEELRAVFGHEIAHIRRGDAFLGPLLIGGLVAYNVIILFLYFTSFPDTFPLSIQEFSALLPSYTSGEKYLFGGISVCAITLGLSIYTMIQRWQEIHTDILGIYLHEGKPEQLISALEKRSRFCSKEGQTEIRARIDLLKHLFRLS